MSNFQTIIFILGLSFVFSACKETVYTPKPRSFPRVEYPQKGYQAFASDDCPFVFEYPTYCNIQQEKTFFDEQPPSDCWFDVYYPSFDGSIYFTYYPLASQDPIKDLNKLRSDAFNMANWHNKRANYIDEIVVQTPNGISGIAFDIDGPSASPFQFFLTDSLQHFVRGALYFNTEVNTDSLAPIVDFVEEDILQLIQTFEWDK